MPTFLQRQVISGRMSMLVLMGAAFGVALCFLNGGAIIATVAAQHWPTTTGTVLQSWTGYDTREYKTFMGTGGHLSQGSHMTYRYKVGDENFTSENITSDESSALAIDTVNRDPVGSTVQVFYNPARPSEAYLNTSLSTSTIAWFVLGIMLIISAIFCLFRIAVIIKASKEASGSTPA